MISTTCIYLFQTAVCWIILLAFYHVFLRGSTHYQLSRIYLLSALLLGGIIPLLPNFYSQAPEFVYTFQGQMEGISVVVSSYAEAETTESINWGMLLQIFYFTVTGLLFFRIIFGLIRIKSIKAIEKSNLDGVEINFHSEDIQPFSFLNRIFIPIDYPKKYQEIVLAHELSHVRQRHSIDILCSRIFGAIFWINPMVRIFEAYLKEVHEHHADQVILSNYDLKTYHGALRFSAFSSVGLNMAHAFNSTNIRKRLSKMKKSNSKTSTKLLYAAILPIGIFLSMAMNVSDDMDFVTALNNFSGDTNELLVDANQFRSLQGDTIPPAPPAPPKPPKAPESSKHQAPPVPPAPQVSPGVPPPPPPAKLHDEKDYLYKVVDEMPRFPGCENMEGTTEEKNKCATGKLIQFIGNNIKYPALAKKHGVDGVVIIQFTVSREGKIKDAIISRNVGYGCGEEALRVVKMMNDEVGMWIPGVQKGKTVNVQYHLPVKFKIDAEETKDDMGKKVSYKDEPVKQDNVSSDSDELFKVVENRPRFPGCEDIIGSRIEKENCSQQRMLEFLYKNITYPEEAKVNGTEGTVVIQFVVEKDGSISGAKIVRQVANGCGEEALRVVNLMNNMNEKWVPGMQRGQHVRVEYNLPVKFKMADDMNEEDNKTQE